MNGAPDPRQVHVDLTGAIAPEAQAAIPSFVMNAGPTGPVLVHHATFIFAGEYGKEGNRRISLTIGQQACQCGCGARGRAMMYTPEVEHAREIARQLIEVADAHDAAAAEQAAAAFRKAAGMRQSVLGLIEQSAQELECLPRRHAYARMHAFSLRELGENLTALARDPAKLPEFLDIYCLTPGDLAAREACK